MLLSRKAPSLRFRLVLVLPGTILVFCLARQALAQADPSIENLGASRAVVEGDWIAYAQWESFAGRDLNADGDTVDTVVQVRNRLTGAITNVGLASSLFGADLSGDWLVFTVSEQDAGKDLNGDGDTGEGNFDEDESVVHLHHLPTGETTNLGLAVSDFFGLGPTPRISGERLVFAASESAQGVDLDADGDTEDTIVHVRNLSTGETTNLERSIFVSPWVSTDFVLSEEWLVFFAPGRRLHVHHLPSGETTELRAPGTGVDPIPTRLTGDYLVVSERAVSDAIDDDTSNLLVRVHHLVTGERTHLKSTGGGFHVAGDWLAFAVSEEEEGDLNDDADTEDFVVHVHNLLSGQTENLGLAALLQFGGWVQLVLSENWLMFAVPEAQQGGTDLNGDGDTEDNVVHLRNLSAAETNNLSLAGPGFGIVSGDWLAMTVSEGEQSGTDLNGDGDTGDNVTHVRNLSTAETTNLRLPGSAFDMSGDWLSIGVWESLQNDDLNSDGDTQDFVTHIHNLATGTTTNLGIAGFGSLSDDRVVLQVREASEGRDLNGDRDTEDSVAHSLDLTQLDEDPATFIRGDCDGDGVACSGTVEALALLFWLFQGAQAPPCVAACDANGVGGVDVTDVVYGLNFCFRGTRPPVAPFPKCGVGALPGDAALGCAASPPDCR